VINSPKTREIMRLDYLEARGWFYYHQGRARGSTHTIIRAERLIDAAHKAGMAEDLLDLYPFIKHVRRA
jgi:hypothetical protein